ncbi:MAG: carbohydrate ABC transporter permease [Angelakisella sp.]
MVASRTPGKIAFSILNMLIMLAVCLVCVLPMWHVVMASISDPILLQKFKGILLTPLGTPTLKGYELMARNPNILTSYGNTLIYVAAGTTIGAILSLLAGYILSRKTFRYRNALMFMITFTMLFKAGMIPQFIVVKALGLLDTRWAVILPTVLSVFNITIMRTAIAQVPASLEESARIDGAGDITILCRIIFPLVRATFAVVVLFYAVARWNEWFNAMIYLKDRDLFPLQLILREILIINQNSASADLSGGLDNFKELVKYATIVVATVPILCIYPFIQKYFVTGVMVGAVKE